MKKQLTCLCILLLSAASAWCDFAATVPFKACRQIDCKVTSCHRRGSSTQPHIKLFEATSLNWSGYAALTNLINPSVNVVTSVYGSWTVPAITPSTSTAYSSVWVGIDGYSSSTVEQIGTEQDSVRGRQSNYAWFEMYPNGSYELVGFPVNVGDVISGQVTYLGSSVFQLTITNHTRAVTFTVPSSYTISRSAKRSSAEWVVEAPSSNYGVLPLAQFSPVTMTGCIATINGVSGPINSSKWQNDQIAMATNAGVPKAQPSTLSSNGESFTVTWHHQ